MFNDHVDVVGGKTLFTQGDGVVFSLLVFILGSGGNSWFSTLLELIGLILGKSAVWVFKLELSEDGI